MKKPASRGSRHLDDDEAADWEHTARSIAPLKRAKSRVHESEHQIEDAVSARPRKPARGPAAAAAKAQAKPHPEKPSHAVSAKAVPPVAQFDRKKAKKIRTGHIEIEARIDLHGMRQDEAHAALRGFIHRTQARGLRWVLVITGKGLKLDDEHERPFDMTRRNDRGVLKRNVPRWLEEPDLRGLVVSYTTAAIAHGGEGALYVHLRKRG